MHHRCVAVGSFHSGTLSAQPVTAHAPRVCSEPIFGASALIIAKSVQNKHTKCAQSIYDLLGRRQETFGVVWQILCPFEQFARLCCALFGCGVYRGNFE